MWRRNFTPILTTPLFNLVVGFLKTPKSFIITRSQNSNMIFIARMAPNSLPFSVLDFLWEEIKSISQSPLKIMLEFCDRKWLSPPQSPYILVMREKDRQRSVLLKDNDKAYNMEKHHYMASNYSLHSSEI